MSSYIPYVPTWGTHIRRAAREAIELSRQYNRPVRFSFNGVRIIARKRLSVRHICNLWEHASEARSAKYRSTPQYREAQRLRAEEGLVRQFTADNMIERLPECTQMDYLMRWIAAFSQCVDCSNVEFNHRAVAEGIKALGHEVHWGVGQPPEWFSSRYRIGRWIAGQTLDFLNKGLAPHPSAQMFVEKYFELPAESTP